MPSSGFALKPHKLADFLGNQSALFPCLRVHRGLSFFLTGAHARAIKRSGLAASIPTGLLRGSVGVGGYPVLAHRVPPLKMVPRPSFELGAYDLAGRRSLRLSYRGRGAVTRFGGLRPHVFLDLDSPPAFLLFVLARLRPTAKGGVDGGSPIRHAEPLGDQLPQVRLLIVTPASEDRYCAYYQRVQASGR